MRLAVDDPLNSLFSGTVLDGRSRWLADLGMIGKRADGLPAIQGIPVSIVWWIALTLFCTWLLTRTRFGNWIFAAGGDANAARNLGVPVARTKIMLFAFTALAATLFAAIQVLVDRLGRHAARHAEGVRGDHRRGDRRHAC